MARHILREAPLRTPAIAVGTIIYTLDGTLPVEYLAPGDRIITRAGMRVLRAITRHEGGLRLHFDRPEVIYADGMEIAAA